MDGKMEKEKTHQKARAGRTELHAGKGFNKFLKLTLGKTLINMFNIKVEGDEIFKELKPPYIIIGNHTNFYDPFIMSVYVPDPIYFVTADNYFRSRILRFLLKYVGAIPKTKFMSDSDTVRMILKVRNKGGIVGVYPEGRRNWDGNTLPVLYPTAKLVKSLGIPVVSLVTKGGYLSYPRWAINSRKGLLILDYKMLLDGEKIKAMSVDEVYDALTEGIRHDEYKWQRENMVQFKGRRMAEKLEFYLFMCPECRKMGQLKSHGPDFTCKACGYVVIYNDLGFFELAPKRSRTNKIVHAGVSANSDAVLHFDNPSDWNDWQLQKLYDLIIKSRTAKSSIALFQDRGVLMLKGGKVGPLKKVRIGQLLFFNDDILFNSLRGESFTFQISMLSGSNVQKNSFFEFYYEKTLYRFFFKLEPVSAYKWVRAIRMTTEAAEAAEATESTEATDDGKSSKPVDTGG